MNKILIYNISVIILGLSLILLIVYITMYLTKQRIMKNISCPIATCKPCNEIIYDTIIYDERPSLTYEKMFNNASVGFGYQDFDENDSSNSSFYVKANK